MSTNCTLERVDETRSTNDDLLARWRAGELISAVARMAHKQTAGKGRAGRSWLANPDDSLCFSLAHPFKRSVAQLSGLSLTIGLAVIAGIAAALHLDEAALHRQGLRLKWPNDVLLNNAKLGGILIEGGQTNAAEPTWMVIGVGLNLRHAMKIQNTLDTSQNVSALDQLTLGGATFPDTDALWLKIIESIEQHLNEFEQHGFCTFQDRWMQWDAYKDRPVCISGAGKEAVYGLAKGVDESGALLLQQESAMVSIHAGDVSLRVQS